MKLFLFFLMVFFVAFSSAMADEDNSLTQSDNSISEDGYTNYGSQPTPKTYTNYGSTDYSSYDIEPILQLYPSDERKNARKLSKWLSTLDKYKLGFIVSSDDPCKQMECRNISSSQVKQLASEIYSEKKNNENRWLNWTVAFAAVLSALISFIALFISIKSGRRSAKNEVKIDSIKTLEETDNGH